MEEYKPVGLFVVENEKGQYIYDGPFTEGGYLISKSQYKKFRVYQMRYILGIVVGTLFSTFIPLVPSIIVAVATVLVGEFLFRFKFLVKQCIYMPRFKRPAGAKFYETIAGSQSRPKKLIKAILFVIFAVLLVLNAYNEGYSQVLIYVCWAIGVICVVFGFVYLIAFFKDGGKK